MKNSIEGFNQEYAMTLKKEVEQNSTSFFIKATIRFELMIRVLQTHALPLGYVAI